MNTELVRTDLVLTSYWIYIPVVIVLTIFTARMLFANGKHFMLEIFPQHRTIALATNRLFEIGFYLLNIGFALVIIRTSYIQTYQGLMEVLSSKIGGFSIYLGILLLIHLFLFIRGRSKARRKLHMQNPPLIVETKVSE